MAAHGPSRSGAREQESTMLPLSGRPRHLVPVQLVLRLRASVSPNRVTISVLYIFLVVRCISLRLDLPGANLTPRPLQSVVVASRCRVHTRGEEVHRECLSPVVC